MASGARTPRSRTTRTQASIRPFYETFEPKSEMKENKNAYLLHIYLPGQCFSLSFFKQFLINAILISFFYLHLKLLFTTIFSLF